MKSKFIANLLLTVLLIHTIIGPAITTAQDKPDAKAIADILNRIRGLEEEVNKLRGDRTIFAALEEPYLGATYYSSKREHFFVGRLVFVNLSSSPVVIKRDDIVLQSGTDTYNYTEIPSNLRYQSVPNGRQTTQLGTITPRAELKIASGGTGTTWVRFTGIPTGSDIPKMILKIEGKTPVSIDVNQQSRDQLGLTIERIGPRGSLAMLTIDGVLNPINAGAIVDELALLADKKVVRAVIRWADSAPVMSSQASNWLQTSATTAGKPGTRSSRSDAFPTMPGGLRELHLSSLPGKTSTSSRVSTSAYPTATKTQSRVHPDDLTAVTAALKTAYERVPLPELLADIESGSKLTRIAAITCGGGRLPTEKLPMLLKLADDADPEIQKAAIIALGHFGEESAVNKLESYVRKSVSPLADVAIASLAQSRFPAAHEKLLAVLKNETPETRKRIVALLAKHPRAAWADAIYEFASDPNSGLVLESTQALALIGHPNLLGLLAAGLKSKNQELKNESFRILSTRQDAESEELAIEYTLTHMEKTAPTAAMLALIGRTRDQRALPKLLHYFEKAKSNRQGLITAISKIGDQSIVDVFVKQFPRLDSQEKTSVMSALASLDWKQYRKMAGDSLKSDDSSLISASTKALQEDGSDEAIAILTEAFIESSNATTWNYISRALTELGTASARKGLYKVMDSTDSKQKLQYVDTARRNMMQRSPGAHYWRTGQQFSQQEKYPEAIEQYNNAIEADPKLPEAYSARGYSYLKQSKYNEAIADFKKALELDERNGLAKAGKSIALVEQGDLEEGVKQVEADKEKFKTDSLFAYNSCCVYGTAMKKMKSKDESAVKSETYLAYQQKALDELERSLSMGFNETELINSDPDLDLLRDLPEYKEITSKLPKPKPKPKTKPKQAEPEKVPEEKPVESDSKQAEKAIGNKPATKAKPADDDKK